MTINKLAVDNGQWIFIPPHFLKGGFVMPTDTTYYLMDKPFRIYQHNISDKNRYYQEGQKGEYLLVPKYGGDFNIVTPQAFKLRWPPPISAASKKMSLKHQPTATSKDLVNSVFITDIVRKNKGLPSYKPSGGKTPSPTGGGY